MSEISYCVMSLGIACAIWFLFMYIYIERLCRKIDASNHHYNECLKEMVGALNQIAQFCEQETLHLVEVQTGLMSVHNTVMASYNQVEEVKSRLTGSAVSQVSENRDDLDRGSTGAAT